MVITLGERRVLGIACGDLLEVEVGLDAEGCMACNQGARQRDQPHVRRDAPPARPRETAWRGCATQ